MKKEFIVNRQGKDFALYAGLLDQAHREGLTRITTTLLQAPSADNGELAICHAEVQTTKGTFSGIGDASPQNVGAKIAPHIVRMAETRAKARALRDAINVGVSALEELEAEEGQPEQAGRPSYPPPTAEQRGQIETAAAIGLAWFGFPAPELPDTAPAAEGLIAEMRSALAGPLPEPEAPLTLRQRRQLARAAKQLADAGGAPPVFPDSLTRAAGYGIFRQLRQQLAGRGQAAPAPASH